MQTRFHVPTDRWRRLVALVLCALALTSVARAQATPSVSASLNAGVARLGERVVLSIAVENAREARVVDVPSVEGLEFGALAGPSRSSYTQIVNGRVTRSDSLSWQVLVTPRGEGDYEIPPVTLEVDGRSVSTRPQALRVVRDLTGEELGFLEVNAVPARVVEGQAFTVEVVFGWDRAALSGSSGDQYAELSLPWWDGLPGLIELEAEPSRGRYQFVVNRRVRVNAERLEDVERDGRPVVAFRIVRRWMPTRSGEVELPDSFLEFGLVQETFFRSEKVRRLFVGPVGASIPVVALPEEGRPFDYSGAVGSLRAKASVDGRDVVVGDSIKLTVDWTGEANLEFFEAPDLARLDAFRAFRVYGTTEDKRLDRRRVVYDLAPLEADVDRVPPVPLVVFDPETMSYVTVATDPIPVRVRELEGAIAFDEGLSAEEKFEDDVEDVDARPLSEARDPVAWVGDRTLAWGVLLVPLVLLGTRAVVRARRGDPGAPSERRRRRAARGLARSLAGAADDRARLAAFEGFLAARSRRPVEVWQGGRAAEVAPELAPAAAATVDATLERLAAASWGGGPSVPADEVAAAARAAIGGGL